MKSTDSVQLELWILNFTPTVVESTHSASQQDDLDELYKRLLFVLMFLTAQSAFQLNKTSMNPSLMRSIVRSSISGNPLQRKPMEASLDDEIMQFVNELHETTPLECT